MMGPGGCQGFLNDHWNYVNWQKVVNLYKSLLRSPPITCSYTGSVAHLLCVWYCKAVCNSVNQVNNHHDLSDSLDPTIIKTWMNTVEDWEKDPSQPDLYYLLKKGSF